MATLNIKGLPDALYRKLRARAKRERRSVAQEVIYLLTQSVEAPAPLSVLDLKERPGGTSMRWRTSAASGALGTDRGHRFRPRRSGYRGLHLPHRGAPAIPPGRGTALHRH